MKRVPSRGNNVSGPTGVSQKTLPKIKAIGRGFLRNRVRNLIHRQDLSIRWKDDRHERVDMCIRRPLDERPGHQKIGINLLTGKG